ncbi:MAG: alcohol dehydrogenase catalytic domain-containing protein [Thermotogae bacterium]|nr:alcohol dehydrogenase catalytic domain-containing protein [Thermotogota bacterium]
MKAAVFEDKGILNVRDMNINFPENWIKVRVKSAGICGSDLNFWFGNSLDIVRGKILGHEISGTILEIPKNYDGKLKIGDDVVIEPLISCGKCEYCKSGKYYLCKELKHIGIFFPGGFAEITAAPPEKLFLLPSNLSHDLGALADVVAVAIHCMNIIKTLKLKKDISVCIVGDGPVALSIIPVLKKLESVHSISLIGKHQKNIDLAKSIGVKAITSKEVNKYDVVIEAVGGRRGLDAFDLSFKIVKPGGTLVVLGQYYKQLYDFDIHRLVNEELKLIGSFSYGIFDGKIEIEEALSTISELKDYFENIITHRVKLDEISKGFEIAANKDKYSSIKIIIKPD